MCGRFTARMTWAEIVELYKLTLNRPSHNLPPRYNICPTDPVLTESCFNKRPDAPHDAANRCEFIVADYYLLECLLVLAGELDPTAV
jgi:hypothetical protein